ncbi:MAG: CehA/McbA family metallohydrolase [Planctomycetota bacterium]|nr:CehA/McbA family metallohydrolase [Planctomycetota bacterium]MEC7717034.1 CehA/McbA family metallohydrolase [Planctomycetota bacterium]
MRACLMLILLGGWVSCVGSMAEAQVEIQPVAGIDAQPLKAQIKRLVQALEFLGQPLPQATQAALDEALGLEDPDRVVLQVQEVLDSQVLIEVNINPESRVKVSEGPGKRLLTEQGWTVFLVKVHNEAGVTAPLRVSSPNAGPIYLRSSNRPRPQGGIGPEEVADRWMDVHMYAGRPLTPNLSGLAVDYRLMQIYSRDRGKREASLAFDVGQGTQDLGFRNEVPILFECLPAVGVELEVIDHDGEPTTASFVFRDSTGRVYPARSRRLAPDFFFHDQVYRAHGEKILLPPGSYTVTYTRGPEYRVSQRQIEVPDAATHRETFRLKRWIKLTDFGWYSGDHHVHAAGCAHYESPTEGVTPEDMMRHILGEDLNVGCVLAWGPCWYYQKQFFEGDLNKLSQSKYLMRYDVEVSGFPSSHTGHLCLLNLREDDYVWPTPTQFDWSYAGETGVFKGTKTEAIGEWPSWDLPVLQFGKKQGGVVGFSHSGWGLAVQSTDLPNYEMPKFDGIGANEYIVDVVHDSCDFISAVDTPSVWELNIWYHTLNCGFTTRISGETDFPCIYGERVGLGRVYVKTKPGQPLDYVDWIEGIKAGRSYVGDGLSHLVDFSVDGLEVGQPGDGDRPSVLVSERGKTLDVTVQAAAYLDEQGDDSLRNRPLDQKPYWHLERSRVEGTRQVPVELVVNGEVVETKMIEADGDVNEVRFDWAPERSSWVALRIYPSSHTNPIFVEVDGEPIRASRRSAKWCLEAVDVCWKSKVNNIREFERPAAKAAFDEARRTYTQILVESYDDREVGN